MNYTDHIFFAFLSIAFCLYYLANNTRTQLLVLIIGSLIFYSWHDPTLLPVFLASWIITSLSTWHVLKNESKKIKLTIATLGVTLNVLMLFFFKYKFLFFVDQFNLANSKETKNLSDWLLSTPLPVGISFYTFHGISLLVDTYKGSAPELSKTNKTRSAHLSYSLLYLVFFPQIIAGPIIKAKDFFPQIYFKKFNKIDLPACSRYLILGYFLKTVVADNLSQQTFWIAYPYFQWKSSGDLLAMLYGYSAQIFADFAGYSLIAIGLAKLFGYELPINFNFPYTSSSLTDFWKRWHISLSSWLRDYLYIPLGGSRHGNIRTYINLLVVMMLGGLWHGAAINFVLWGVWHGLGLALERPFLNSRFYQSKNRFFVLIRILLVFNFVTIGWLLFNLNDFSQAWTFMKLLFHNNNGGITTFSRLMPIIAFYSAFVIAYHVYQKIFSSSRVFIKDAFYGVMLFLILTNQGPTKQFIYFQF